MKLHRRPLPRILCNAEDTADFGWGPVDVIPCNQPATHRSHYLRSPYPAFGHDPNIELERVQLCGHHVQLARDEHDPVKFYRFRTVGGAQ